MRNLRLCLGLVDFEGINEGGIIIEIRRANAPAKLFPSGVFSPSTLKQNMEINK